MEHPERVPSESELREVVGGASATAAGVAQEMFAEAVIPAARYIISVASGTEQSVERIRFQAAQDIVNRVLGKETGQKNAWDEFSHRLESGARAIAQE